MESFNIKPGQLRQWNFNYPSALEIDKISDGDIFFVIGVYRDFDDLDLSIHIKTAWQLMINDRIFWHFDKFIDMNSTIISDEGGN